MQNASAKLFFTGLFITPPRNFFNTEKVEIDIIRSGEKVAIVVQDISAGYRYSSLDLATNKEFTPPVYQEANPINSFDLLKRQPGNNPFENIDYRATLMERMFTSFQETERKIRRAIEWQSAQVLQTGKVSLINESGNVLYILDYKPKTTHFPTAPIIWDQATADPIKDIISLADIIRKDGLVEPDQIHMGKNAFEAFLKNEDIAKRFDNRNYLIGTIGSIQKRGKGGKYRGNINIGSDNFDIFTYDGMYENPETSISTPYLDPGNVIIRASEGRMDLCHGAVPNIGKIMGSQGNAIMEELPRRINSVENGIDLFTNVWISADGHQLFCGVACRPIVIPTAIDSYGCLKTGL